MNKVKKKLKSLVGESIGETLVALLISALALMMLAGAVTSATKVVTKSKTHLEAYYAENNKLDNLPNQADNTGATVTLKDASDNTMTVDVEQHTNSTFAVKPVIAYALPTTPSGG